MATALADAGDGNDEAGTADSDALLDPFQPSARVHLELLATFGKLKDFFDVVRTVDEVRFARAPSGRNVFDGFGEGMSRDAGEGCGDKPDVVLGVRPGRMVFQDRLSDSRTTRHRAFGQQQCGKQPIRKADVEQHGFRLLAS